LLFELGKHGMESPLINGEEMAAHLLDPAAEKVQSFENH
jgi:hypothetical protein